MRLAVIDSDAVVNVIEAEPGFEIPGFLLVPTDTAGPGWRYIDGVFVAPEPEPEPVPQSVTPAQGLMALYVLKGITEDDVLAAINSIEDPTLRYQAQIAYKKATSWDRGSVTMQTVAQLLALTQEDMDQLFTLAATYTNM